MTVTADQMLIAAFVGCTLLALCVQLIARGLAQKPAGEDFEPGESVQGVRHPGESIGFVTRLLAGIFPQTRGGRQTLEMLFIRAGQFSISAAPRFLAVRNFVMLAVSGVFIYLGLQFGKQNPTLGTRLLAGGLIAVLLIWALPGLWIQVLASRRIERIRRSLPYILDMLSLCVSGSGSVRDAIGHVSRETHDTHPDTSTELTLVREQTDLATLDFALQQFSRRMDIPEVAGIVGLISQFQHLGVGAEAALHSYSDSLRLKWRQAAEERANSKTVKLLFPLALCLLPSMMMLLWGPAAVDLFRFMKDGGLAAVREQVSDQEGLDAARERTRTAVQTRAREAGARRQLPTVNASVEL
ncbi:MAG: type II secretion system F family protein [Planctomycetes bacterium]|nr:type II secretion system F family protein [Planctomycetota bacterium]